MSYEDINLLTETVIKLARHNLSPCDVSFVTGIDREGNPVSCSWNEFAVQANRTYDNSLGVVNVDLALKIVGDDWWLERCDYDGSEWWEFKRLPQSCANGKLFIWRMDEE